jgi:hypothetical protein
MSQVTSGVQNVLFQVCPSLARTEEVGTPQTVFHFPHIHCYMTKSSRMQTLGGFFHAAAVAEALFVCR